MSIPYVVDGVTDLDSALFNPIIDAINAGVGSVGIFNVVAAAYGAIGNGVTDDTEAIQSAIDAAEDAGGGIIYFPAGRYLLTLRDTLTISSAAYCLMVKSDNITFRGDGRTSVLVSTDQHANGQTVVLIAGHGKSADSFATADMLERDFNLDGGPGFAFYEIDPADQGADSITLATSSDHSHFSVGDTIYIRTGQTLAVSGESQPDAEINVISAINTGTGVLSLKYPTTKPYAQEYFPDADKNDSTTTSSTAWPAIFGVANVSDAVVHDFAVENLHAEIAYDTDRGGLYATTQVFRPTFTNATADLENCSFQVYGPHRFMSLARCNADQYMSIADDVWISGDRGCTDMTVSESLFTSWGSELSLVHMNEGSANIAFKNSSFLNGSAVSAGTVYSAGARGYNHTMTGCKISGEGSTSLYGADGIDGLVLDKCDLSRFDGDGSVSIADCTGVVLGTNLYGTGLVSLHESATSGGLSVTPQVISAWCFHNSAGGEVIIGRLPKYALVTDISIYVETAFNAGSPTIQVGNESFANIYMDAAAAVSAQGYATISLTDYAQFQSSAADTAVAYITPSGSSAGKALVTMTYINGPVPS
jgi:hypothetical protein